MNLRVATRRDVPAVAALIEHSGHGLGAGHYTPAQIGSLAREVFGVDTQLIDDGTYYVAERGEAIIACGGWSRRRTLFGGDRYKAAADPCLDPAIDAARIRAFFVHPDHVRRGLGRRLLAACTDAARAAGFTRLELVATLPGEPLYAQAGFEVVERLALHLADGVDVPVVRMQRAF